MIALPQKGLACRRLAAHIETVAMTIIRVRLVRRLMEEEEQQQQEHNVQAAEEQNEQLVLDTEQVNQLAERIQTQIDAALGLDLDDRPRLSRVNGSKYVLPS